MLRLDIHPEQQECTKTPGVSSSSSQNLTIVPVSDKKLTKQNEQTVTDGVQTQRNDRERVQILSEAYQKEPTVLSRQAGDFPLFLARQTGDLSGKFDMRFRLAQYDEFVMSSCGPCRRPGAKVVCLLTLGYPF